MENTVTISVKEYDELREKVNQLNRTTIRMFQSDCQYEGEDDVFLCLVRNQRSSMKALIRREDEIKILTDANNRLKDKISSKDNQIEILADYLKRLRSKWWYKLFNGKDK